MYNKSLSGSQSWDRTKAQSLHWMNEDPANDSYSEKQLKASFSNARDNLFKLIKKFMIMNVQ